MCETWRKCVDGGPKRQYARTNQASTIREARDMRITYEAPAIVDYGSIADHTFDNPGKGDKAPDPLALDKWGENSHLIGGS